MINIVTGKGLFIHYYFNSVLLLWSERCLLLRWVVYLIVKQVVFFFTICIEFPSTPPQFCVAPMPLVMVHNHWCISDDVIIVHLLFCCVGFIQFYEPRKWILEAKEKVIPYNASTVRIPSLCTKARFYRVWEILGPPGIIFFIFWQVMSHIQHLMSC